MSKKVIFFLTHILYQNQTNEFALTSSMIEEFQKSECKAINCYHSIKTDIINDFFTKYYYSSNFFACLTGVHMDIFMLMKRMVHINTNV